MSAPMIAENLGHHSCLKTLLATEKVNLNLQDKQGRDVLGHAVISNSLEIVKCVMELGFNQTNIIRDQSFIAAIFEALVVESEEIFTYLLSKNALPTPCTVKGRTLLANILICNYLTDLQKAKAIDLVLTLTQVDINESSKGNKSTTLYTPLMIAAEYGSCEVIAVLLENDKIDIQVRNSKGETARDIALKAKNYSASLMIDKHTLKQKPAMSRFV